MKARVLRILGSMVAIILLIVAAVVIFNILREYRVRDIVQEIRAIPMERVVSALFLSACGYLALTGYDYLGLRNIGKSLAYPRVAMASFIGYSFSNNVGFPLLAGGSIRYRLYSGWGLSALEVSQVVAFCSSTFWFGVLTLGGASLLLEPPNFSGAPGLAVHFSRGAGIVMLSTVGLYLLSCIRGGTIRIRGWSYHLPGIRLALSQVVVATIDWMAAAGVLYVLLPDGGMSYPRFVQVFLLAQVGGIVSQVPGGLGVFESVVLLATGGVHPAHSVMGLLVAYRAIYYWLPLLLATVLLAVNEVAGRLLFVGEMVVVMRKWAERLAPSQLATVVFSAGTVLLVSGALPAGEGRLDRLRELLPLPFIETSHFMGSVVGAGLLILARGLQLKLDGAWVLAVALLGAGSVFSIAKGLDFGEAVVTASVLALMLPFRRSFRRRASLLGEGFSSGWGASLILVVVGSVALGLFSHKHVAYSHDLWWHFSFAGEAPRFMRASVGACTVGILFALARILRPAPPPPHLPGPLEMEQVRGIVSASRDTTANLALLGDKNLLFSQSGRAFIMYSVAGRSWVSMGDPIGRGEERRDLVWRFRELCDKSAGWPVYYEVRQENVPLYLDLGLVLTKIGEEARVDLPSFTMEGAGKKDLRHALNRYTREGAQFEMVPPAQVPGILAELRGVSDAWLKMKKTREKRFSIGFFSENYLNQTPVGVVRKDGRILAFANVWAGGDHEEVSVDLMRHRPDIPSGAMDFVFSRLMLWAKEEGYRWFNLGMAPLSGLPSGELAPFRFRAGAFVFRTGGRFYNFQGLREFKEKFSPVWSPRYLASPGGFVLPLILKDLAKLVGGGLKGIVAK